MTNVEPYKSKSGNLVGYRNFGQPLITRQKLFYVVRRSWRLIAVSTAICFALSLFYLLVETPLYEADAEIIIDTNTSRAMQSRAQGPTGVDLGAESIDNNLVDSEVEVLGSEGFARLVVRALDLTHDDEFVGPPDRFGPRIVWWLQSKITAFKSLFSSRARQDDPEKRAVEAFEKRLSVKRKALTYVISISFQSNDAAKGARIVNAVAETYLKSVLDSKYAAARRTGQWLKSQLAEMRQRANEDDRAVQAFKSENHIVDTNRGLMNEQQLADLNFQLTTASASVAETRAKLDRAKSILANAAGDTIPDALSNVVISRLRAQYLDLAARAGDLAARFGSKHAAVVKLRNQMEQIQKAISAEVSRIISSYEGEYQIALAKREALQSSLDQLVTTNKTANLAQVKLKDLESSAETSRALLTGYLQKYQDASQLETFPISDARIITEAVSPLKPSTPKNMLVLVGGAVFGVLVSSVGVVASAMLSNKFSSKEDVEILGGVRCLGLLPRLKGAGRRKRKLERMNDGLELEALMKESDTCSVDMPFSRFAEVIRGLRIALVNLLQTSKAKVVGLLSATVGEGKTTVAMNLGLSAARGGLRTIVIDCDQRTRGLTSRILIDAKGLRGLNDLLKYPIGAAPTILIDDETGLHLLPFFWSEEAINSPELLSSRSLKALIDELRRSYDLIIVDLPAAMPAMDTRLLAPLIDTFVLLVQWECTPRTVVREMLSNSEIGPKVSCAILNDVDDTVLLPQNDDWNSAGT